MPEAPIVLALKGVQHSSSNGTRLGATHPFSYALEDSALPRPRDQQREALAPQHNQPDEAAAELALQATRGTSNLGATRHATRKKQWRKARRNATLPLCIGRRDATLSRSDGTGDVGQHCCVGLGDAQGVSHGQN
ncbi:hypothetical protein HAX54_031110 [Datura stramonium]|uniref:Uncharacterized protein n=1 Tax=Datura stramonium TaxID=4076 RepID=A0ABS8V9X2_DATST|nr:hypothetical protein [Datura stramonium]